MEKLLFKQTLDIVKSKITLQDLVQSYGIKCDSPNRFISCPFHSSDNTPSCKLYSADKLEGSFFCFGCKKSGDILSFVCFYENKNNLEALNSLCIRLGIDPVTRETTNYLLNSIQDMLKPKKTKNSKFVSQSMACVLSQQEYNKLTHENLTPYLLKKQVPHLFGTKSKGTMVVVPVCNVDGVIQSLHYIHANDFKDFFKDGKRDGGMFRLGPENEKFAFLCEGYSTSASVFLALEEKVTVYCCFTAGNIRNVHDSLKEKYPGINLIVAGDNDTPGHSHGLKAVYPPEKDMDFNDFFLKYGPERVKNLLGGFVEKAI